MKLYWSEARGFVLGSCNLTQNGLGDGEASLREIAYYSEKSDSIRIDEIASSFDATIVTPSVLAAYRKKYALAAARRDERVNHGVGKSKSSLPTFGECMASAFRSDQRIIVCWWVGYDKKTPGAVLDAVRSADDRAQHDPEKYIADYMPCATKPITGDWLLGCKIGVNGDYGRLEWTYTHLVTKRRANSADWISVELVARTEDAPFDCREKRFVGAFRKFAEGAAFFVERDAIVLTPAALEEVAGYYA